VHLTPGSTAEQRDRGGDRAFGVLYAMLLGVNDTVQAVDFGRHQEREVAHAIFDPLGDSLLQLNTGCRLPRDDEHTDRGMPRWGTV
jgi:hypothetical protein